MLDKPNPPNTVFNLQLLAKIIPKIFTLKNPVLKIPLNDILEFLYKYLDTQKAIIATTGAVMLNCFFVTLNGLCFSSFFSSYYFSSFFSVTLIIFLYISFSFYKYLFLYSPYNFQHKLYSSYISLVRFFKSKEIIKAFSILANAFSISPNFL